MTLENFCCSRISGRIFSNDIRSELINEMTMWMQDYSNPNIVMAAYDINEECGECEECEECEKMGYLTDLVTNQPMFHGDYESFQLAVREDANIPPIHQAALLGNLDAMQLILNDQPNSIHTRYNLQSTPLHYAAL